MTQIEELGHELYEAKKETILQRIYEIERTWDHIKNQVCTIYFFFFYVIVIIFFF